MTYVIPNERVLPALPPEMIADGWEYAPEVIDDNMPNEKNGHGTAVACLAGATSDHIGVAPQTNLYLLKWDNFYIRQRDGLIQKATAWVPYFSWIDTYTRMYNAWLPTDQNGEGIDPHKSVVNLSNGKLAEPEFERPLVAYMITGARSDNRLIQIT